MMYSDLDKTMHVLLKRLFYAHLKKCSFEIIFLYLNFIKDLNYQELIKKIMSKV